MSFKGNVLFINMHAKDMCTCVMITSCVCPVALCIHIGSRTQARCVLPVPLHPAGDLQMERDWCLCVALKCGGAGYSRSSLEHTQILFFYASPYITPRQHPASRPFCLEMEQDCARREPAGALFLPTHRNCTFHPAGVHKGPII